MVRRGKGIEVDIPKSYDTLREEAEKGIHEILKDYPKAEKMYKFLVNDGEVNGYWDVANFMLTQKLKYNDHGEVHAKIVAYSACKMLSLLKDYGIKPDFLSHGGGDWDDEFLIVLSAALLHDIGNLVIRPRHYDFSVSLAIPILNRYLPQIYGDDLEKRAEVKSFILNALYTHEAEVMPYTLEGAIVGLADGTDMTKGRGRLAFDLGEAGIHTVSALSIEKVIILKGEKRPIRIVVEMSNSAGVFQVEEILAKKIRFSPLENYVEIYAITIPTGVEKDRRIVYEVTVKNGRITAEHKE